MIDLMVDPAARGHADDGILHAQQTAATFGLEEEMFLVDAETLDCVTQMPEAFRRQAEDTLGDRFKREMIASMVELVTGCHTSFADAGEELRQTRTDIAKIADRHGLAVMACATHPFSAWREQTLTPRPRYDEVAQALQLLSTRGHACGLHVHVSIPDPHTRIAVMNEVQQFLPLLLALSASSPFWMGEETGLKSYRTALTNEIPRSGLPGVFDGPDAYDAVVDALKRSGAIPDESYLWWAVRPSAKFPTLEMRMTDTCTDARDALAIAALYRALVHRLAATVGARGRERRGSRHQIVEEENRWQAARYGLSGRFIDDTGAAVGMATAIRALVDWVSPSSEALRLEHEIAHIPSMIERGTSADGQIAIYRAAISEGANASDALRQVARDLVTRTRRCE